MAPIDETQYLVWPCYSKICTETQNKKSQIQSHCWKRWKRITDPHCKGTRTNHGASPEFISHKDDSTLQQQGGKDSYNLPYTEAAEQTVKVHVFQSGVGGPPQLNDLNDHKRNMKFKSAQFVVLMN